MSSTWIINEPPTHDDLAAALHAVPVAAEQLRRLAALADTSTVPVPFHRICNYDVLFPSISPVALRLLQLDRFHGGVTREAALAEAPLVPAAVIDAEASNLVIAGLARLDGDVLTAVPELPGRVAMALPMLEDEVHSTSSERLLVACRLMGLRPGSAKADRANALIAALRDPEAIEASLASASAEARRIFGRIVELTTVDRFGFTDEDDDDPSGGVALDRLLRPNSPEFRAATRDMLAVFSTYRGPSTPLGELVERQLISSSMGWGTRVWLFMEVAHAMGHPLGPELRPPPSAEGVAARETPMAPTRVVAQLGELVSYLRDHPVEGKKSGDRRAPVATWRSAAKTTGIDADLAVLLGALAADLGLIYAQALPARGRGRKVQRPVRWRPNEARVAEFDRLEMGTRWMTVVEAWLAGGQGEEAYLRSTMRSACFSVLASLPVGRALEADAFVALARGRHLMLSYFEDYDELLQGAAALGIIGDATVPGLTAAGRAATTGLHAVNEVIGGGARSFVVQPDHSVVAPPDLAPDLVATLLRYADLESEGGASVWRLSALRLAQAAPTTSPRDVQRFLADCSSVPVPDAVHRFVDDAMGSVSPVTVDEVGCVISADDPVAVADAARHKTAKLTVLAPGFAVSPLTAARVRDVLATKGIVLAPANAPSDAQATGGHLGSPGSALAGDTSVPPPVGDAAAGWVVDQPDPNQRFTPPLPFAHDESLVAALLERLSP
ncbi:MAG: helicase-associated domain-containing protein [Microthrixaceae bacterium]